MKFFNVIIAFLLAVVVLIGTQTAVLAQSNLLPEKTDVISTENSAEKPVETTSNQIPVASSSAGAAKTAGEEPHSWEAIIAVLMLTALFLLFLEIAIIPGFGVCGITGIVLLVGSIGLAFWKLSMDMAVIVTVAAVVGVMLLIAFMIWVLPQTRLGRKFVLQDTAPVNLDEPALNRFIAAEGVAVSNLRPSGIAKIADERVDVITEGDFVEKGTRIKVIKVTANRVIVAPIEE